MHLSKQEFSKLSKADKAMLMRGKQQPQKRKTGKKLIRKDNKIPRNPSNKTNSVAAAYSTGTSGRSL